MTHLQHITAQLATFATYATLLAHIFPRLIGAYVFEIYAKTAGRSKWRRPLAAELRQRQRPRAPASALNRQELD